MSVYEYIKPELIVLVPALCLIGLFLKKSRCPDNFIPLLLGGIAVIFSFVRIISDLETVNYKTVFASVFSGFTQGILVAGCSVYINQLYKQKTKGKTQKENIKGDDKNDSN